jgi:hypothetical protein
MVCWELALVGFGMGIARVYRYQLSVDFLVCLYSSILLFFGRFHFFVFDMLDEFVFRCCVCEDLWLESTCLRLVVYLSTLSGGLDRVYGSCFYCDLFVL